MRNEIVSSSDASQRDRFILSRLNHITKECQSALTNYSFAAATTALHSFFLYDLCDVYLELVKPVFADSSSENSNRKRIAQATLYTVLEQYLRLLHPLMPYLTEELWQRLPNRKLFTQQETIMLSSYPKDQENWTDLTSEQNMETVKELIHSARSLRVQYKIANHIKADFYFKTDSLTLKESILAQADDFCTLAKGNFLQWIDLSGEDSSLPKGYCITVVSDQLSLLVNLTGLIDIDTELIRLKKEIERLNPLITTYSRKMTAKDYETKVPEDIRNNNAEKLKSYQTELDETMKAINMFESMKI
jgi:valyl-tRNA synthetase